MPRITTLLIGSFLFAVQACGAINAAPGAKIYTDLAYVDHATPRQKLDLAVPPLAEGQRVPLLVYIHGGAWKAGSKQQCPLWPMTRSGYAVASIDYRFSTDAIWPAQIDDCRAALQYLAEHAQTYGIDPARFAVAGDSAGGHLALFLGLSANEFAKSAVTPPSYQIRCILDFYGPTDLCRLIGGPYIGLNPVDELLGGKVEKNLKLAAAASPITYIDQSDPPVLAFHGDHDQTVPVSQSYELDGMLKAAGVGTELIIVPGAGHGGRAFAQPAVVAKIATFFDRYMKN